MADSLDPKTDPPERLKRERPELLVFCGLIGLAGTLAPVPAVVWATSVAEHQFIADTISDLARGPHRRIMDTGFYMNAAGLIALAIAAAHAHLDRLAWSLGLFCLTFLALVVVMLGLWDEFQTGPQTPPGMTVHTRLSLFLGPLYLAGPLLMARGAAQAHQAFGRMFVAAAVLWLVFATAFKFAPTNYDGVLEKIALASTMLWTLPLSWMFLARGRRALALR